MMGMMGMRRNVMEVFDEVFMLMEFDAVRYVWTQFEYVWEEWEDKKDKFEY